jgi:hypothetical protein
LTFDELLLTFNKVIKNEQHYSQSALKMLELQEHTVEIDLFDKQILFCLSKGIEAKDIPQYTAISSNAIEVRKLNRKLLLKVPERRAIPTCCAKPEILDYYFKKGKKWHFIKMPFFILFSHGVPTSGLERDFSVCSSH